MNLPRAGELDDQAPHPPEEITEEELVVDLGVRAPATLRAGSSGRGKQARTERKIARHLGDGVDAPVDPSARPVQHLDIDLTKRGMLIELSKLLALLGFQRYSRLQDKLTHHYTIKVGAKAKGRITMRLFEVHTIQDGGRIRRLFAVARYAGLGRILAEIDPRYQYSLRIRNYIPVGRVIPDERRICNIQLTDNQVVLIDHLMAKVYTEERRQRGSAGCTIVMDTGAGKTWATIYLAVRKLAGKTLVVCPNDSVVMVWADALEKSCPQLRIGYYTGRNKIDGDVILTIINSALVDRFVLAGEEGPLTFTWSQFYNQFETVVYDEIHNYPTAGRQAVFWRAGVRCTVGLTATPDERLDEMDVIYTKHVGPIVRARQIPGYNVLDIEWKGVVRVLRYSGKPEHTKRITSAAGTTDCTAMYKMFCSDPYRNRLVLSQIRHMAKQNHEIFVFAEHREYLEYLYGLLAADRAAGDASQVEAPELGKVMRPESSVMTLMGGSRGSDHAAALTTRIILVTYAYAKEGISIVKMTAILFATPRRNKMRQIIGRILRRGGDPSVVRQICDIVDQKTTLRDQYKTRLEIYKEKGFEIVEEKLGWAQFQVAGDNDG